MDNDLMARRLRPPSEPSRPQNGHSPLPDEPMPWAPDVDDRADIPWDRPAAEAWPPGPEERAPDQSWPPAPASADQQALPDESPQRGAPDEEDIEAERRPVAEDRPSTWDVAPSPWDSPTDEAPQANEAQPEPEPDPTPEPEHAPELWTAAPEPSAPEAVAPELETEPLPDATDIAVAGRPAWDRPEPFTWNEPASIDDRPPDMLAAYDEMIPAVPRRRPRRVPAAPPVRAATRVQADVAEQSAEQQAGDPYDAFAPILGDVPQPAAPSWPSWSLNGSPPAAVPEMNPVAVPPSMSGRATGPTPPDDLFAPPPAADQGSGQPDGSSAPALYSTQPAPPQPMVLRIELAIVDDSTRVRPVDAARHVGPWVEPPSAPAGEDRGVDPFTPRHPEFEPRSQVAPLVPPPDIALAADHAAAPAAPAPPPSSEQAEEFAPTAVEPPAAETPAPVDLPWALPPLQGSAHQDAPWAQPQPAVSMPPPDPWYVPDAPAPTPDHPTAAWTLQPAPPDPLTTLPAATFAPAPAAPQPAAPVQAPAQPAQPPQAAPAAPAAPQSAAPAPDRTALAAAYSPPVPARPASEQPDLWFLSSEPETFAAEEPAAARSSEPSTVLTAGLTVLMAVVVIGLVLAFLWLMTSLPILR